MTKEKNEEALRRIKIIHPDLRRAVASSANADRIFDIGKKYNLLVDKIGELASETMYLMLGVTNPDEFVGNLAERLQVDRETASKIADDINREIFAPVREHLRGMFGTVSVSSGEAGPTPLQPRQEEAGEKEKIPPNPASSGGGVPTLENGGAGGFSSLEDMETELAKALAKDKGAEPLSVVKKQGLQVSGSTFQDSYKGADPYREQVEEDLPNVRPKTYSAPPVSNKKEISEVRLPETGRLTSKISPASGGQGTQPTPTPKPVEEDSPFSPLREQKTANNIKQVPNVNQRNEKIPPPPALLRNAKRADNLPFPPEADPSFGGEKQIKGDLKSDNSLQKFRGINMQSLLKEQGESKAPEAPAPIEPIREPEKSMSILQQKPPVPPILSPSPLQQKEEKDPYKEPII